MAQDINKVDISTEMKSDDYLLASIGGKLRRVKVDKATEITKEINEKIENTIGSDEFNTTLDYATGDYVIYENVLYKFINDKPAGPWDASVVVATSIGVEIMDLQEQVGSIIELFDALIKIEPVDEVPGDPDDNTLYVIPEE